VSAPLATNWFGWQHYLPLDDNLNRKLKDSVEEAYCIGWPAGRKIIARWLHTATHHDVRIIVEPFWHNFFTARAAHGSCRGVRLSPVRGPNAAAQAPARRPDRPLVCSEPEASAPQ
jgi:hypothetical protein